MWSLHIEGGVCAQENPSEPRKEKEYSEMDPSCPLWVGFQDTRIRQNRIR